MPGELISLVQLLVSFIIFLEANDKEIILCDVTCGVRSIYVNYEVDG